MPGKKSNLLNNMTMVTRLVGQSKINSLYFNDIRKFEVLSKSEERKLLVDSKSSNQSAKDRARKKLIECNQRFVISAVKCVADDTTFNDLIGEANVGLIMAIDSFDLNYSNSFLSYAKHWVTKYIIKYLVSTNKMVRPKNALHITGKVRVLREKFLQENGRYPNDDELRYELKKRNVKISEEERVNDCLCVSISQGVDDEEDTSLSVMDEFNSLTASNNVEDFIHEMHVKELSEYFTSSLDETERYVIRSVFGIDCIEETFENIGFHLGISEYKARAIYAKAMEKIRLEHNLKQI